MGRRLSARLDSPRILALGLAIVGIGNALMMRAAAGNDGTWLAAGMLVLGAGGGLLNGETQKAIMGAIPRNRTGTGSGISTTSRFCGILLGFAGLWAVLAGNARSSLERALKALGLPAQPGFLDNVVAGDLARGMAAYPPAVHDALAALARKGYRQGSSRAFLAAAIVSLVACAIACVAMKVRVRRKRALAH
ncbi:MFS transporter [Bordetella genomosp. 13]|uniref:MFS transporter n=1 Tax=Bordetella genomosp. 13 TaxID=463040 RepID=UPI0011A28516|nr:MFS transporter [Bordetella genomosp. 13]